MNPLPIRRSPLLSLSTVACALLALLLAGAASHAVIEFVTAPPPPPKPAPLPADAREIVARFDDERAEAQREMEAKLAPRRKDTLVQLKVLQDKYTKAADLDQAVAIRDYIRQVVMENGGDRDLPLSDPGTLMAFRGHIGKTYYFEVTGSAEGAIWGTGVYTDDSPIVTAAVHAGLLKDKEKGVVKVSILPAQAKYEGSELNGVTSQPYGQFEGSYRLDPAPKP